MRREPCCSKHPHPYPSVRLQVQHFDLTVCCVSLSVSPITGELQWSIPYLSDIAAGALAPTQYLVNHKRNLSKSEQKRNKILIRVAKYSARGYTPTVQLQQILDKADRDVAKARARAAIEAAQGYGGRAAYIAKLTALAPPVSPLRNTLAPPPSLRRTARRPQHLLRSRAAGVHA